MNDLATYMYDQIYQCTTNRGHFMKLFNTSVIIKGIDHFLVQILGISLVFHEYKLGDIQLIICKSGTTFTGVKPSSLAKGYDSGPPSLHPWQI